MDPFCGLSARLLLKSLFVFFIATLSSFLIIAATNQPLENHAAPLGILSLQFAGEVSSATKIVGSWSQTGRLYAAFNLGFDYLYLVSYSLLLSLTCSYLARARQHDAKRFSIAGFFLAWAMFAAAVLDIIENYALWQLLLGSMAVLWPKLATLCATLKFGIILVGTGYIVVGAWVAVRSAHR